MRMILCETMTCNQAISDLEQSNIEVCSGSLLVSCIQMLCLVVVRNYKFK
jgi:hypothetical protein